MGQPMRRENMIFLDELYELAEFRGPSIMGRGGFNLVRGQQDKSNGVVDQKWCDNFN
jgi:hypothetical protein